MTTPRTLRASFITTVAVAAGTALILASGCGSSVVDQTCGDDCPTTSSGNTDCPYDSPAAGQSCNAAGQVCLYMTDPCFDLQASCTEGGWALEEVSIGLCNPPACPPELPAHGESCAGFQQGDECLYNSVDCPGLEDIAYCDNGAWAVAPISCNPPPPDYCFSFTTPESCMQQVDCNWQVPGCGEPALPVAGCHPTFVSCQDNDWFCFDDTSCQKVVVDPCWDSACQACGEETYLCVADFGSP